MKIYIHLALLPTLMLLDYFLTIWSQKLGRKTWRKHFIVENFELNPMFQEAVSQERWFNPGHFIRATLTSSLFILAVIVLDGQDNVVVNFALGTLLMMFCLINANHVSNLFLYHYANQNPSQLSGTVTMEHQLSLYIVLMCSTGLW